MVICNRCNDKTDYQWYQVEDRWKLGIMIDINNYRPHICPPQKEEKKGNKRNWVDFICTSCGCEIRQNMKLVKDLSMCLECRNHA